MDSVPDVSGVTEPGTVLGPSRPEGPDEHLDETSDEPTGAAVLEQAIRIATGLAALAIASVADTVRQTLPTTPPTDEPSPDHADPLGLLTGAALGFTLLVGERTADAVGGVVRAVGPPASWFAGIPPLGPAVGWLRQAAISLDERWRATRPDAEEAAASFARELVPQVVDAVLDQLDLTWLVAERVDLDQLVAGVDLDAAVARVDIDRIIARIDLDDIAARIDVGAIVDRVDVDAVAGRLDLDAVVARIDLVSLARYVVDEIDLPEIIRVSTGTMASETVREARMQGIEADAAVARAVDRVLLRRRGRDTEASDDPGPGRGDDVGVPGPPA